MKRVRWCDAAFAATEPPRRQLFLPGSVACGHVVESGGIGSEERRRQEYVRAEKAWGMPQQGVHGSAVVAIAADFLCVSCLAEFRYMDVEALAPADVKQ